MCSSDLPRLTAHGRSQCLTAERRAPRLTAARRAGPPEPSRTRGYFSILLRIVSWHESFERKGGPFLIQLAFQQNGSIRIQVFARLVTDRNRTIDDVKHSFSFRQSIFVQVLVSKTSYRIVLVKRHSHPHRKHVGLIRNQVR